MDVALLQRYRDALADKLRGMQAQAQAQGRAEGGGRELLGTGRGVGSLREPVSCREESQTEAGRDREEASAPAQEEKGGKELLEWE